MFKDSMEDFTPICDDKVNENPACPHKEKMMIKAKDLEEAMFTCLW